MSSVTLKLAMRSASRYSAISRCGGGDGVVVDGLVEAGEGVGDAADIVDELHVLVGLHVGRAAEHHVLEHVGEPLAVGPLVPAADVVEHPDVDHRRLVQRRVDHPQAVVQRLLLELDGLYRRDAPASAARADRLQLQTASETARAAIVSGTEAKRHRSIVPPEGGSGAC